MKLLTTLLFIFITTVSFAQDIDILYEFAVVKDKDGYCNVRSSAETGNNITDKLNNGQFVYVLEKQGNWMSVVYIKNSEEKTGYIYHDRLNLVSRYKNIPVTGKGKNHVTLGNKTVTVTVTQEAFDKSKHKFTYYNNDNTGGITHIDGREYYGTDGNMPTRAYQSIVITIGAKKLTLPKAALENLFQPTMDNMMVHYDEADSIFYIHSQNSDGAGSYSVIWKVEKGVYKGRYVSRNC